MIDLKDKRVVKLLAISLGVLILGFWFFYPSTPDITRFQDAVARGDYATVKQELERALARDPDWHEARELLVPVLLRLGEIEQALENVLFLAGAGQNTVTLERRINGWIAGNTMSREQIETVTALKEEWHQYPTWTWLREVVLLTLFHQEQMTDIPQFIVDLSHDEVVELSDTVGKVWQKLLGEDQWKLAWEIAIILDGNPRGLEMNLVPSFGFPTFGIIHRVDIINRMGWDRSQLSLLQESFPGDPLLAIIAAAYMEGQVGLDWLTEWEKNYTVEEREKEFYSQRKKFLLETAPNIKESHFANLLPLDILDAVLGDWHNDEKRQLAVEYLGQFPELEEPIGLALDALKPQNLIWSRPGHSPELLGNGWVFYAKPGEHTTNEYHNILTGARFTDTPIGGHYLSANGQIAVFTGDDPRLLELRVYNSSGRLVHQDHIQGDADMHPLGWKDDGKLWIWTTTPSGSGPWSELLAVYDLSNRTMTTMDIQGGDFLAAAPGGKGLIAWTSDSQVIIYDTNHDLYTRVDFANPIILGWQPDGAGLIFTNDQGLFRLDYKTADVEELDLRVESILGWRSNTQFYFNRALTTGRNMLAFYDLNSGSSTMTGIMGHIHARGELALVRDEGSGGEIRVYKVD